MDDGLNQKVQGVKVDDDESNVTTPPRAVAVSASQRASSRSHVALVAAAANGDCNRDIDVSIVTADAARSERKRRRASLIEGS